MTVSTAFGPIRAAAFGAAMIAFSSSAALAQAVTADTVAATVNGKAITEGDLAIAAQNFRDELAQIPPQGRRRAVLEVLIDIELMARAAEASGLDQDEAVAHRLQMVRDRALRAEYLRAKVFEAVTDEAVQQRFDEMLADFVPGDEISASHILVASEEEANAVIADLDAGGDFAAVAKEKSLDPGSAANGGSLGFFARDQMVKPFEDAAFALEVGSYTKEPVQSDFGWHVIRLDEKRKQPPPTLADESDAIREALARELFAAEVDRVRAAATIDIVEPETPAVAAPPADRPAQ
jgi:peptidyl-prolyl cis-trans isomerase C